MVADAALASVVPVGLRRDRILATATLALLVTCVFDVGRVLYYRMLLNYAVTHSARVLARDESGATPGVVDRKDASDLVRRLSGVKDLSRVGRATWHRARAPARNSATGGAVPAMIVIAHYTVPLVSAPLWPVFVGGCVAIDAVGSHAAESPPKHDLGL